ncbi:transposase family protein, partial [Desulfogranum japonicum]|uniref:transposase family protein n=3 Tax=Desulfogranum japonicum TaxID=231447 RepID=UPI001377F99D
MRDIELFQMALGLTPPWQVSSSELDLDKKRVDIYISFQRGSTFTCPKCGEQHELKAYDTKEFTWRHLNFFQHEAYLTAKVPRVKCPQCGF